MGPDDMDTLALDLEMLGFADLRIFKTKQGWQVNVRTPQDAWIVGIDEDFCRAVEHLWRQVNRVSR